MSIILKDILLIISGLAGGYILILLKNKFFGKAKEVLNKVISEDDKNKVKDLADKGIISQSVATKICSSPKDTECFNKEKAISGMTNLKNPVLWMKDIASLFNLRKLIIIGVIIGVIFGYGYWKGRENKPVNVNLNGKEVMAFIGENRWLHITKEGEIHIVDNPDHAKATYHYVVKTKDIPALYAKIKPYGIDIKAFVTAGGSLGQTGIKPEAGIGLQYFRYFKWYLNAFITNVALYPLGLSYQITDNFDILAGYGYGYKGDQRIYIGGKWRF
jgi:hypothetical protein